MMNLWEGKETDLKEKTGTKEVFKDSGVYEVTVKEAYLRDSTKSQAKAIAIAFENKENYVTVNFWFNKGDGSENEFARKALNRMFYLMKLRSSKLNTETKKVKLYSGDEVERTFFTDLAGKEIGIILNITENGDNTNYDIKDFFNIKSRKTSDEILNNTEGFTVKFYEEKFAGTQKQATEEIETVEDDDEFPF